MKTLKCIRISLVLLSFIVLFTTGCTEEDSSFEGYILDVEEGKALVIYDTSAEKYDEISDKTIEDI